MAKAVIVGAGMGGLAAAISLSARPDWEITVVEAASRLGGKVGWERHDGVAFDTGPSLLTLPGVLEEVCRRGGCRMEDHLTLLRSTPAFRYDFFDGSTLDVAHTLEGTARNVGDTLGATAAREFRDFLEYARRIWEVAAPHFVWGSAPTMGSALKLGLSGLKKFRAVDPMRTMADAIDARISDRRLRDFFWRYATYNGSDPRRAPATLNCICWVEQGLGFWGVQGGMSELVSLLETMARRRGVEICVDRPVISIGRGQEGFKIEGRDFELDADSVVVNADIRHLVEQLAAPGIDPDMSLNATPSMSAWTAVIRARRRSSAQRPAHRVIFADGDYAQEFADIFDHQRVPRRPAIYLCAREKAHRAIGWEDEEPLFVMLNMPAMTTDELHEADWTRLEERVLTRLRRLDHIDADDEVVWRRTPEGLAQRFPGSRGSLYGAASNGRWAAFERPSNRVDKVPGLYLASGSAHPGGGVPLSLQSGLQAVRELLADFR